MRALLSLENVFLRRPAGGTSLFELLNWAIFPGERWAVIGPEGCGKSTLHRLMAGLIHPDRGAVLLNGSPCATVPHRSELLGVLFCEPVSRFLTPVVWEEVALTPSAHGLEGERLHQRVTQALQWAGVPECLATQELASLSSAQCARVALAAVLAARPQILLADEPGAQLSAEGENEMAFTLTQTQALHAMASVIFTSRMERAKRFADRYVWLVDGKISFVAHGAG